jgi:hypothetical protein
MPRSISASKVASANAGHRPENATAMHSLRPRRNRAALRSGT